MTQGALHAQRQLRTLFKTAPIALVSEAGLAGRRHFLVGFQLPADLPPSFRGSSVRYSYSVDVRVVYDTNSQNGKGEIKCAYVVHM